MSVDQATVRRIARLARIRISDNEVPKLEGELNRILDWIELLNEVDTASVEPMTSVVSMQMRKREDEVTDGGYPGRVTANAPQSDDNFYMVPKVVE
ncbi:MAG: Asp-tRNA(Asn)/Glu-tRNA(Gln) amidotransferase subunit GatC [Anderseniella sp.]|jgi:aspartyl-tRNA(Asn)/glutamyl-tRNA(Gln) amidotransferase subunit C|nr:Asp-tRNA(Asn)/Glu-tRNA(Gln) amidotransferase subunit GatC [Anderseniella sp.]